MRNDEPAKCCRRWFRYAQEDLASAEALFAAEPPVYRNVCWHSQQAAEKAIKAVLVFLQADFPKSHDLVRLRGLLPPQWDLATTKESLARLSEWGAETRYPGEW